MIDFEEYKPSELKCFFELQTGEAYPYKLEGKKKLLQYYQEKGYSDSWEKIKFSEEQSKLLDKNLSGIWVVNAGPGTGKTTVVNARAYELKDEGVMIISYTNAAINENYKRIHYYPTRGIVGKKNFDSKITITTVDALASHISKNREESYNLNMTKAYNMLKKLKVFNHQHMIVDECQDIDELRGDFILKYFEISGMKSLVLFGDPRQRLDSSAGGWYSRLWENHSNKIGFSISYRFKESNILNLVNTISETRPRLHHRLIANSQRENENPPITIIMLKKGSEETDLLEFSKTISSSESVAVIGFSLNKNNVTSSMGRRIYESFTKNGLLCNFGSEGSYQPKGILFSTIHSIKGKEFDDIIIFGMSHFPNTFPMLSISEAESIIYVAHSRARHRIYYINYDNFSPPLGIPKSMYSVDRGKKLKITKWVEKEPESKDIEIENDQNLITLLTKNGFRINKQQTVNLGEDVKWFNSDIIDFFLSGKHTPNYSDYLAKKYKIVSESKYMKHLRSGEVSECLYLTEKMIRDIEETDSYVKKEEILLGKLVSGTLDNNLKNFSLELKKRFKNYSKRSITKDGLKVSSLVINDFLVDINPPIISYCKATLLGLTKCLSIYNGNTYWVTSDIILDRWEYILKGYSQIYNTVNILQYRKNQKKIDEEYPNNIYTVDTEFNIGEDIFEIALVNIRNPYESVFSTLRTKNKDFASLWLKLDRIIFDHSPDLEDISSLLNPNAKILYYGSFMDKKICELSSDRTFLDLSTIAREVAKKYGYTFNSSFPKLTDIYTQLVSSLEWQTHIRPHTALSDALMLMELYSLNHLTSSF